MSAESFDECEMGESLMVNNHITWLKKRKLSLVFLFPHSPAEHIKKKQHPCVIPINLSLLNHSNLFLWMPKIYIFHKLLQQGILQCYGPTMVPILFLALARCVLTVALHTLFMAKLTAENLQWNDLLFCLATHQEREMGITLYFTLVNSPQWLNIHLFSWMRFPPQVIFTELLLNLNEMYIRNSPHCHQSHCSWPKHRASKLLLKIYTLYIISRLLRWAGRLLTFLRVNCNFWFVVNTTNVIFNIPVR